jgi:LysM repeat protein
MKSNLFPFLAVLFCLAGLLALPETGAFAQQVSETHTVQPGETLFSIARDFNLSVGDLRRWNELDSDNLSIGQVLRVVPPRADNQITHTVQPGETLFALSRRYNVTIAEIQQWNNLRDTNLETGRELTIFPAERAATPETLPPSGGEPAEIEEERQYIVRLSELPAGNTYYTVRSGDTLYRIANDHNMTVNELRVLNGLDNDMLRVGQQLTVRETRRTSAPSIAETAESSTPQGKFVQYRVESGENGPAVLRKFQMSEAELLALNPGISVSGISPGQRLTVLLPPTRTFKNPYRRGASLEDLGSVPVYTYRENEVAAPTTSGELYNPDQLTAAHSNMELANEVYIENPNNCRGIFIRINDRHSGDGLKLSHLAFDMLGFSSIDQAKVTIYMDN